MYRGMRYVQFGPETRVGRICVAELTSFSVSQS